jgi:hypothetical protein
LFEVPIDVTVICECRHNVRFNHPSNLDFHIETLRGKVFASAAVDLGRVIQCPIETILLCRNDSLAAASLHIEVLLSKIDSELVVPMARQVEQRIMDALATTSSPSLSRR